MKILFLSDTHLGFGRRIKDYPDRSKDAYIGMKNALDLVREEGVNVVLHGGDLFDTLRPSYDTLHEAVDLLTSLPRGRYHVAVYDWKGDLVYERDTKRTPFIAIHGNHDWNQRRDNNVYTLLEKAGLLVYAHRRKVVVEGSGERICVAGVGWIPDRFSMDMFSSIPKLNCDSPSYFLFHQPVRGLYPSNPRETLIPPSLFPEGFDLYLGGHLHWIVDKVVEGKRFLIPGSTVITKLKEGEMDRPRIIYMIEGKDVRVHEIPGVRRAYLVKGRDLNEIKGRIEEILSRKEEPTPIVKVVLEGEKTSDIREEDLRKMFEGRAMIYLFDRRTDEFYEHIRQIRGEIASDAFSRDFIMSILRERMGEEWEDWMEDLILKILEGEEVDVNSIEPDIKEQEVKDTTKNNILDWVEE